MHFTAINEKGYRKLTELPVGLLHPSVPNSVLKLPNEVTLGEIS